MGALPSRLHPLGLTRLGLAALAVGCVVWAGGRSLGLERGFPLVPLMAWTPFATVAAALVAVLAVALKARAAAVAAAASALVLTAQVAPRALPDGGERGAGRPLTVLSVNLHRGLASPTKVVDLARRSGADVVSLQEVDAAGLARLDRAGLRARFPSRVVALDRGHHGTALYAREPLRPRPRDRGTFNAQAVAALGEVEITAVHPPAPSTARRARAWRDDLHALPGAGGRLRILAGDFNATLDHAPLRRLLRTGYRDAADVTGSGLRPTWPVGGSLPPVTIDHVLASERIGVRAVELHEIDGSDHRALLAEVVLPR